MKLQKNGHNYYPSQPEIMKNTLLYQELKPVGLWYCQDVALFYQFKTDFNTSTLLSLIPDGCFDLLFCCDPSNPAAFLWTSPSHRKKQPEFRKDCIYFGVRFFPEQSLIKLNTPMKELLNQQILLNEVMSDVDSLVELILSGRTFSGRMEQFEKCLRRFVFDTGRSQKLIRYAMDKIYSSHGNLNVSELSDEIGYSEQHIRRRFEEFIGFSPKQICQIVRFQNTLDMYLHKDEAEILDIIYENGYYDQAHFIKGFKKFIDLTPKQYKMYFYDK